MTKQLTIAEQLLAQARENEQGARREKSRADRDLVLAVLSARSGGATIREISDMTGMSRSKVSRMLGNRG